MGRPLVSILGDAAALSNTAWVQPALMVIHTGLARLLEAWGVGDRGRGGALPRRAVRRGVVAGVVGLDDGLRLAWARGSAMAALPRGAMIAVMGDEAAVHRAMPAADWPPGVQIAAYNAMDEVVLAGPPDAVARARARLTGDGLDVRPLASDRAFHTAAVAQVLDPLAEALQGLTLAPPRLPLVSLRTGQVEDRALTDPSFWIGHATDPVRAVQGLATLASVGADPLVDLGGRPVLAGLAARVPALAAVRRIATLPRGQSDPVVGLASAVGQLFEAGVDLDWGAWDAPWPRGRVALPTYPFDRRRFWLDEARSPIADWTYGIHWIPRAAEVGPSSVVLVGSEAVEVAGGLTEAGFTVAVADADAVPRGCLRGGSALGEGADPGHRGAGDHRPGPAGRRGPGVRGHPRWRGRGGRGRRSRRGGAVGPGAQPGPRAAGSQPDHRRSVRIRPTCPTPWRCPSPRSRSATASPTCRACSVWPCRRRPPRCRGRWWVTGGLGALGRAVAAWLVDRGATALVLTGRTPLPEADDLAAAADPEVIARRAAVAALRERVAVEVVEADAADEAAMRSLAEEWPPDGVVHAAGITHPQSLQHTHAPDLRRTLSGKAGGARVLDAVLAGRELQGFVLFSSVAATWGSQGLLAYAAANAYLDGLARGRRHRGLPATSVAWGPWAGGGHDGRPAIGGPGAHGPAPAAGPRGAGRPGGGDGVRASPHRGGPGGLAEVRHRDGGQRAATLARGVPARGGAPRPGRGHRPRRGTGSQGRIRRRIRRRCWPTSRRGPARCCGCPPIGPCPPRSPSPIAASTR